jgi:hypothetical protein
MFNVKGFYVAFFSDAIDCYERCGINMGLEDAKKSLASRREVAPDLDWVILAVLDV